MGETLYFTKEMLDDFLKGIEQLRLRKMTHKQVKLMFLVLLSMAGRISEVLDLTPEDILPNGKIRLRRTKGGWENCKCSQWAYHPTRLISSDMTCDNCKGVGKIRINAYAWVQESILYELRELASETRPGKKLFPITRRQALNYANDIADARTHTFRHTWLTWLLESEKLDIKDMQQKARHKNVQTTIDYVQHNTDFTRKKEENAMPDLLEDIDLDKK